MGLTVALAVGSSGFDDLPAINAALARHGVPTYAEPRIDRERVLADSADAALRDGDWPSFPYGFLHYVRRIAVRLRLDETWAPDEVDDPADDDVFRSFGEEYFDTVELEGSHLYAHADNEGFYVPVDFERVIHGRDVPGRLLGSSQRLLGELALVGAKLGFDWGGRKPSEAEIERAIEESDEGMPFFREKHVFAGMYEVARLSVAFQTAIVFR